MISDRYCDDGMPYEKYNCVQVKAVNKYLKLFLDVRGR